MFSYFHIIKKLVQ